MGNIGGFGGYRCNHWRAEGELMLNYNPYSSLKIGSFTINKTSSSSTGFGLKGQTTTAAFMVNGYYDFFNESSYFSPYVGLGVGYAMLRSNIKFYFADTYITGSSVSNNSSSPAAQLILGLGYFMDDYTTIGLDYRYFTTKTIQPYNTRNQINSINITLSGSF
jgi:opacity protein-like surface antigen